MELWLRGATCHQIASAGIGIYAAGGAQKAVRRALKNIDPKTREEGVKEMLERLQRMRATAWEAVKGDTVGALRELRGIEERQAKLLGLDAPAKHAIAGADVLPPSPVEVSGGLIQGFISAFECIKQHGGRRPIELPPSMYANMREDRGTGLTDSQTEGDASSKIQLSGTSESGPAVARDVRARVELDVEVRESKPRNGANGRAPDNDDDTPF